MNRNELLALADRLGSEIRASSVYSEYEAADRRYRADNVLQAMIAEYTVQEQALSLEKAKEDSDETVVIAIKARMDDLYAAIMHNDVFEEFMSAQSSLRELLDDVNNAMMSRIKGEEADEDGAADSGCSGNCAACGGCSR